VAPGPVGVDRDGRGTEVNKPVWSGERRKRNSQYPRDTVCFVMDRSLHAEVKQEARKRGITISWLIGEALKHALRCVGFGKDAPKPEAR